MADQHPLEISPQETLALSERREDHLLVDCREPDEHDICNIEGAKLLPLSELAERVEELEAHRDRTIVVHCHHGGRSLRMVQWLTTQGFSDVRSMAGGIERWALEIDTSLARY